MELKWNNAYFSLPDECRPVLAKVIVDGCECIIILTLVCDEWVTDATICEVYGCKPHVAVHPDYTPTEWAYFDA